VQCGAAWCIVLQNTATLFNAMLLLALK